MVSCLIVNSINDHRNWQPYCVELAVYIVVSIHVHNNMSASAKSSVSLQQVLHIIVTANCHNDCKDT